jgi:hypothetical protein
MNEKIDKMRVILTTILFLGSVFINQSISQHKENDSPSVLNKKHSNNLIKASSPYLISHANDPVQWNEWNEATLQRAVSEDKPILVSIGYSSCHWCHEMQKESFQNEEVAQFMNNHFICIKVDREERPDIDDTYMEAVQAMGIAGGWPLNVFLTPRQQPFYGGTYFQKQSWLQVLNKVQTVFTTKRSDIERSAEKLKEALSVSGLAQNQSDEMLSFTKAFEKSVEKISAGFDTVNGGTGTAPKFPNPTIWKLLMRYGYLTGNSKTNSQLLLTLQKMAMGGIHDQVGGGFSRYSTDAFWQVPHFEKMLNDNAQLISLYSEAYSLTGKIEFKEVINGIYKWLNREMKDPQGGFYTAMDADSQEGEGVFYVWTQVELNDILGKNAGLISDYFSVSENGNWQPERNILFRKKTDSVFCRQKNITMEQWSKVLIDSKKKLLEKRAQRHLPLINTSIIASSNALMITGLTDAYRATGDEKYVTLARESMDFLKKTLVKGDKISHAYVKGKISGEGFLDDYAYTIQALEALYMVTFNETYLQKAKKLTGYVIKNFRDTTDGLFNYSGNNNEKLFFNRKQLFDNVITSSNSVMAQNLHVMGLAFSNEEWIKKSKSMTQSMQELSLSNPVLMANWIAVSAEQNLDLAEVLITGPGSEVFRKEIPKNYHPFSLYFGSKKESVLPLLENKILSGETTIYICVNKTCKLPVKKISDALSQLSQLFFKYK